MIIPTGYHTITPYFTVVDADRQIRFMTQVLGGVVIKEMRDSDGKVQHARIRIGDSVVMLNEQTRTYVANASQMHIYVEDVEETYAASVRAGATGIMEPNLRPHGDWMAGIKDPCGNVWWLAQPSLTGDEGP